MSLWCRSVSFLHPEMGEFWYEIQLIADPAPPIQVYAAPSSIFCKEVLRRFLAAGRRWGMEMS